MIMLNEGVKYYKEKKIVIRNCNKLPCCSKCEDHHLSCPDSSYRTNLWLYRVPATSQNVWLYCVPVTSKFVALSCTNRQSLWLYREEATGQTFPPWYKLPKNRCCLNWSQMHWYIYYEFACVSDDSSSSFLHRLTGHWGTWCRRCCVENRICHHFVASGGKWLLILVNS